MSQFAVQFDPLQTEGQVTLHVYERALESLKNHACQAYASIKPYRSYQLKNLMHIIYGIHN